MNYKNKLESEFSKHYMKRPDFYSKEYKDKYGYGDGQSYYSKDLNRFRFERNVSVKRPGESTGIKPKVVAPRIPVGSLLSESYKIADEAIKLLVKKHKDYGPNNISKAPGGPIYGLSVRLHDKVARLSNLTSKNIKPSNETLRDTFLDIVNYAIIALLVIDNKWDNTK